MTFFSIVIFGIFINILFSFFIGILVYAFASNEDPNGLAKLMNHFDKNRKFDIVFFMPFSKVLTLVLFLLMIKNLSNEDSFLEHFIEFQAKFG